jgi:cytochrome b translational activator protein CBS2, mitochondrial
VGRGAKRYISGQVTTIPTAPDDYHFPFGNPALLTPTTRGQTPLRLGYWAPSPTDMLPEQLLGPPPRPAVFGTDAASDVETPILPEVSSCEVEGFGPERVASESEEVAVTITKSSLENTVSVRGETTVATEDRDRESRSLQSQPILDITLEEPASQVQKEVTGRLEPSLELKSTLRRTTPLSNQVHVLGTESRGLFIAHVLAGLSWSPPVRLIYRHRGVLTADDVMEDISVRIAGERFTQHRIIPEYRQQNGTWDYYDHIDNLIVTLPAPEAVKALWYIRGRISRLTTICLVQDGLGLMEELNATLFSEVKTRPSYILGQMTHVFGNQRDESRTVEVLSAGELRLSAVFTSDRQHDGAKNFLRVLTTAPGLWAGGFDYQGLLYRKIPAMTFAATVQVVAVLLDRPFSSCIRNPEARRLCRQLVEEISRVLLAIPEVRASESLAESYSADGLWRLVWRETHRRANQTSELESWIAQGDHKFLNYLNGWFIMKGDELGIPCPLNSAFFDLLVAKAKGNKKVLRNSDVPFVRTSLSNQLGLE